MQETQGSRTVSPSVQKQKVLTITSQELKVLCNNHSALSQLNSESMQLQKRCMFWKRLATQNSHDNELTKNFAIMQQAFLFHTIF